MGCVLDRHRGDQHHAGHDERPAVAVGERAETHREDRAEHEQPEFQRQHRAQDRQAEIRQPKARDPRGDDHRAEHRQRQQLRDRARRAEHQGRAEGHEVAGDVRREEAVQREEACGVDEAGVEAEEERERCAFHRGIPRGGSPAELQFDAGIVAVAAAGAADGVGNLVVHGLDGAADVRVERRGRDAVAHTCRTVGRRGLPCRRSGCSAACRRRRRSSGAIAGRVPRAGSAAARA